MRSGFTIQETRTAFFAARQAAADNAAAELGAEWHRACGHVYVRLPAAWCRSYRSGAFTIRQPREIWVAPARYWPARALPDVVDVVPHVAARTVADARRESIARLTRERDDALYFAACAMREKERHAWIDRAHAAEKSLMATMRRDAAPVAPVAPAPVVAAPVAPVAPAPVARPHKPKAAQTVLLAGHGFDVGHDFNRLRVDVAIELAPDEYAQPGCVIGYIAGDPDSPLGFMRPARVRVHCRRVAIAEATIAAPVAPAPVVAAPVAPVAPAPVAQPRKPVVARPARPRAPRELAPTNPILHAWWETAVAAWRAYESPEHASALENYRNAIDALAPCLAPGIARGALEHAIRRDKPCHAGWFEPQRQAA